MPSTIQLTATPEDTSNNPLAGRVITFQSSNTAVATVDNTGLVTAVAAGVCNITATCESKTATDVCTVINANTVTQIVVSPTTLTIAIGSTQQVTATPEDSSGNPVSTTVTWASSNTGVATVDATGLVTAVAAGTCNITATVGSVVATVPLTVPASGVTRQFWWQASSLSLTNGAAVGSWIDQVAGVAATQTSGPAKPTFETNVIGGQPGVDFELGDKLTFTCVDAAAFTRFVVANVGSGATPTTDAYLFATPMAQLLVRTNGAVRLIINKTGGLIVEWDTAAAAVTFGAAHTYMISYDASALTNNPTLHIGGVAVAMTLSGGAQSGTRVSDAGTATIGVDGTLTHECMGPISEIVFIAAAGGNTSEETRLTTLYGV